MSFETATTAGSNSSVKVFWFCYSFLLPTFFFPNNVRVSKNLEQYTIYIVVSKGGKCSRKEKPSTDDTVAIKSVEVDWLQFF